MSETLLLSTVISTELYLQAPQKQALQKNYINNSVIQNNKYTNSYNYKAYTLQLEEKAVTKPAS